MRPGRRPPPPSNSPFYDNDFVARKPRAASGDEPPRPFHINGPCAAAYARGCRCTPCRQAWRESRRRQLGGKPSKLAVEAAALALEVKRLNQELDAAELNLDALSEENAMLRARLQDHEGNPT